MARVCHVSCHLFLVCMTALLVSSPHGLATRRSLLRFAALFGYTVPEVRCELVSPTSRLAQLLDMDHADYVPRAGAEVPAPVWDETTFRAGRLLHPHHKKFWEELILDDHP